MDVPLQQDAPTSAASPLLSHRRLLSIDFIRGIAILGVCFFHPLIYGVWQSESLAMEVVGFPLLLVFSPLIILATWGGGFPLLTGLVNTFNAYNRVKKGYSIKQVSVPILINSTALLLVDPLRCWLFGRTIENMYSPGLDYSILGRLLERGELAWSGAERIFQIGSLPAIGLSGYVAVIVLLFLFRKGGEEKLRRNVGILLGFGLLFIIISNPIAKLLDPYTEILFVKGGIFVFLAYLLRLFVGGQLSFFPLGTYTFFGMIFGYFLAKRIEYRDMKRYCLTLGWIFFAAFASQLLYTILTVSDVDALLEELLAYSIYPRVWLYFSLSCGHFIMLGLFKRFEYISPEVEVRRMKRTQFLRTFGVASLTFYCLETPLNGILAAIFHWIFSGFPIEYGIPNAFMTNVPAIFLFVATFIIFWLLFGFLWSKVNFKYSLEYWLIKLSKRMRKVESQRLTIEKASTKPV